VDAALPRDAKGAATIGTITLRLDEGGKGEIVGEKGGKEIVREALAVDPESFRDAVRDAVARITCRIGGHAYTFDASAGEPKPSLPLEARLLVVHFGAPDEGADLANLCDAPERSGALGVTGVDPSQISRIAFEWVKVRMTSSRWREWTWLSFDMPPEQRADELARAAKAAGIAGCALADAWRSAPPP
jgi:hypothetical protein